MERVNRAVLIAVAMLATFWATGVDANSHGAPFSSCSDMGAVHVAFPSKSPESCPFGITFDQREITKGGKVTVTLSANPAHDSPQSRLPALPGYFTGYLLMAFNADDQSAGALGTFSSFNPQQGQHLNCYDRPMSALTHVNANFKPSIRTEWVAPEEFVGTVIFKATFTSNIANIWAAVPSQNNVTIVEATTVSTTYPTTTIAATSTTTPTAATSTTTTIAATSTTTPTAATSTTTPTAATPTTTPTPEITTPASAGRTSGSWAMVAITILLANYY